MEGENEDLNQLVIELTKIVRSLMNFIVQEGKSCVDQKQMRLYVSAYLILFAKVMNQSSDPLDSNKIQKQIIKDTEWLNNALELF